MQVFGYTAQYNPKPQIVHNTTQSVCPGQLQDVSGHHQKHLGGANGQPRGKLQAVLLYFIR